MFTYYILVPFLYLFAYLPTGVLYRISSVIAFFLRSVLGYRRKVLMKNLRNSFPEKSEDELKQIAAKFYIHLADRIVENIRCVAISQKEIEARVTVKNMEMMHECYERGQNTVVVLGHCGSWEFGALKASLVIKHKVYAVVSLVTNRYFNELIYRTRGKMGMHLISTRDSKEFFQQPLNEPSCCIFIADQSPSNPDRAYWTNFLNQETGFFTGGERYAKLHNCMVVFVKITETKRGHFTIELEKITDTPLETKDGEITEKFVRLLENQIKETPADWLWSHKRWKHTPKSPKGDLNTI